MRSPAFILATGFLVTMAPALPADELKERAAFKGHKFWPQQVAISPDGRILATGGGDTRGGELKLWDVAIGKLLGSLTPYQNTLNALAFSPDGKWLASGSHDYKVQVWDVAKRQQRDSFAVEDHTIRALAFSADNKRLACAGTKQVKVWDLATRKQIVSFERIVESWRPAFSPDLKLLASPNYQEIDLWDTATGKERTILSEQRGAVHPVAFSGDGKLLAAASAVNVGEFHYQGQIKLWEVATGKERSTLKGQFGEIWALALSPDCKRLAFLQRENLDADFEVRVLDVATSRERLRHKGKGREFQSVAFTADGRLFLMGVTNDHTVKLWEVVLRKEKQR